MLDHAQDKMMARMYKGRTRHASLGDSRTPGTMQMTTGQIALIEKKQKLYKETQPLLLWGIRKVRILYASKMLVGISAQLMIFSVSCCGPCNCLVTNNGHSLWLSYMKTLCITLCCCWMSNVRMSYLPVLPPNAVQMDRNLSVKLYMCERFLFGLLYWGERRTSKAVAVTLSLLF